MPCPRVYPYDDIVAVTIGHAPVSLTTPLCGTGNYSCALTAAGVDGQEAELSFSDTPLAATLVSALIGCTLAALIVFTVVGNSCVILSVTLFRDMRTLTNWLIVSLASADLLVALVVLPVSLRYQLTGAWTMGGTFCDFWITADVFCCTASILNIVVIALDRYWLITRNVRYTHGSRFSRKMSCVCMVLLAWTAAIVISSSPLIGWQEGNIKDIPGQCKISKDIVYTLFSTFGAFWFPLSVIIVVYHRIFNIARRRQRIRKRGRNAMTSINSTALSELNGLRRTSLSNSPPASQPLTYEHQVLGADGTLEEGVTLATTACVPNTRGGVAATGGALTGPHTVMLMTTPHDPRKPCNHVGFTPQCDPMVNKKSVYWRRSRLRKITSNGCTSCCGWLDSPCCQYVSRYLPFRVGGTRGAAGERGVAIKPRRRLRSSARTLGLIIGGFVVCWLPFFSIATVLPFCRVCEIPDYITAVSLWLGYSNSLLNPAIYAIWDKSFKRSFRRLMRCEVRWDNVFW